MYRLFMQLFGRKLKVHGTKLMGDFHLGLEQVGKFNSEEQAQYAARAIDCHYDLILIAKAYRNLLKTMAHSDGEISTFHHIDKLLLKLEPKSGDHCE